MELKIGMTNSIERTVEKGHTAAAMKSGAEEVFSTPCLIAMLEEVSFECVRPALKNDENTVGTYVNVKHIAATPVGMKVRFNCELIEIDRRRLVFAVSAYDEVEKIGEGIHERFIIKAQDFINKVNAKKNM